jgi:septum formation protein
MSKLILASNSPRRKQLLEMAEIEFEVITQFADESYPSHLPINKIANYIAKQKAIAVFEKHPNRKIVSADTIVVIDNKILGKPKDEVEAIEMLKMLSGKTHKVITGVCIMSQNEIIEFYEITRVEFGKLVERQIIHYINKYQPYDKAGAYAIQEWIGLIGIKKIEGCYYNVVGLPINKLISFL